MYTTDKVCLLFRNYWKKRLQRMYTTDKKTKKKGKERRKNNKNHVAQNM